MAASSALKRLTLAAAGSLEALTMRFPAKGSGIGSAAGEALALLTRLQHLDIGLEGVLPHGALLSAALPRLSALTALCLRLRFTAGQRCHLALGPMPKGLKELRCLCDGRGQHELLASALRATGPLLAVTRLELQLPV